MPAEQSEGRQQKEAVQATQQVATKTYITIAVILAVVTAVEVAVIYIDALQPVLIPILLGLSIVKFILVAMYFMHLRYDNALLTFLLVSGMVMALGTFVAIGFIVR